MTTDNENKTASDLSVSAGSHPVAENIEKRLMDGETIKGETFWLDRPINGNLKYPHSAGLVDCTFLFEKFKPKRYGKITF